MLVLTRKNQQSITIEVGGEVITVKLVDAKHNVKIGIEAPRSVRITRSEILQKQEVRDA